MRQMMNNILLNDSMSDWRNYDQEVDEVPAHERENYAIEIERVSGTGQLYISIMNDLSLEKNNVIPSGMSLFIEIRDGKPTVSIGIHEDNNIIHVQSDNNSKLCVINEGCAQPQFEEIDLNGINTKCITYSTGQTENFSNLLDSIAEHAFESYDFGDEVIETHNGWETSDGVYRKTVFIQNKDPVEATISKVFSIEFFDNSTNINSISLN